MLTAAFARLAAALGTALAIGCAAPGAQLILAPRSDTFIRSDATDSPQGANPLLLVGDTADAALRGLLRFDLTHPALPGATIHGAELRLTVNSRDTAGGGSQDASHTVRLHALDETFAEASATWLQRSAGAPWQSPGGAFDPSRLLAATSANPARVSPGGVLRFQGEGLTQAVVDATATGAPLNLLLKLATENSTRSVFRFDSRAAESQAPQLVVDYTPAPAPTSATPLPGHPERPLSTRYDLLADGRPVEVRSERFSFDVAMFTMGAAPVVIDVNVASDFAAFSLKPRRHGIAVTRIGNSLRFTLTAPHKLVLQVDSLTPLAILATPAETEVPRADDPDVLYFGPGITTAGIITPRSNQTVYLAPGALVKGRIEAKDVSNVAIKGRGILETSGYSSRTAKTHGILFERARGVVVEGIGLRGYQTWWQTLFLNSRDIEVAHLNIFGLGVNTDGVDIDGVRDFLVSDTFIRAEDDGLGWHSLDAEANGEPITTRARADNLVIWNTGAGNGIRIGASMETQLWRDILIENVDILMHAGAGIYSDFSDWAWMENLVFRNIAIERPASPITFRILKTGYSNATGFLDERGHYEGLVFENITMNGGPITLAGHDADHRIDRVYFNNCVNAGVPVAGPSQLGLNAYVTNLFFNQPVPPPAETSPGRHEAEHQESTTSLRPQITYADPALSNGKGRLLQAAGVGDHVEYLLDIPAAGVFHLALGVRRGPASARFQASLNGAALAAEQDLFSGSTEAAVIDLGLVSFPAPGTHRLRFTVTGSALESGAWRLDFDYFQLTPALEALRRRHFGDNPSGADASPSADPDGDGLPNLLEYAFGTSPLAAQPAVVETSFVEGRLLLEFPRLEPSPFDYRVEASTDLETWSPLATFVAGGSGWSGVASVSETGGSPLRQVVLADSIDFAEAPRRFLRLRVGTPAEAAP